MLHFISGDMFETPASIRVNTVNCVGVMGIGVALAFKKRYPEMYIAYLKACNACWIQPGKLHFWSAQAPGETASAETIINFPTKRHWRDKSRYQDIAAGLTALREHLQTCGAVRVTIPALGCGHGGLEWARVSEMIREELKDIDAEIYVFEPGDSIAAGERATGERAKKP